MEKTDAPEGCKVEIVEGIITVAPPPSNAHNLINSKLIRCLSAALPDEWGLFPHVGIAVPSRQGLFIPDLVVALNDVLATEEGHCIPAAAAELVAEITSPSNAYQDRIQKAAAYSHAGIPLYLLIDAWTPGGPTVTLYGEPKGGLYRVLQTGKFGDPIRLPEPIGLDLETGDFPAKG
ncbi:DUF820 domain-containing protein [Streptomyces clavuligerus]|uniref:DUF820 domain-containing protein n=1 Tax=Streptomyces clavuligerus TaxID=1901 RepID=E2Q3F6_STRCL|nr:DUF820 domain-containing protein [Streptomyces clavuligerus]